MSDSFDVMCPDCGTSRLARHEFIGRRVKCLCGEMFTIQDPGETEFDQCAALADEDDAPAETSSVAAAQRRRADKGKMRAIGMAAFVGSGVVGYMMLLRQDPNAEMVIPEVPGVMVNLFQGDEAHDWVEDWLEENTPTGDWEELRWSGVKPVKGYKHKVATIKYRTENDFGAKSVFRQHFVHGPNGWHAFDVPSRVVAHDPELFEKLRHIRALVMALDPSEIPLIGRRGTDHSYVQHLLKYKFRDESEPEPPDPNGTAFIKSLE